MKLIAIGFCALVWAGPTFCSASQPHKFNVRDFGALGDGKADDSPAINAAIAAAVKSAAPSVVYLPAGQYRLATRGPGRGEYITITDAKDLSVIGEPGTRLIVSNLDTHLFRVKRCNDVRISTLTFDTAISTHSEGTITAIDEQAKTISISVRPDFDDIDRPDFLKIGQLWVYADPAGRSWDHTVWPPKIISREKIGDKAWTLHVSHLKPEWVGKPWVLWEGIHGAWSISISHSSDVKVDHIDAKSVMNAYEVISNEGDISFSDCVLDVPAGSGHVFSANGGMMVFDNRGTVTLDHCTFMATDDDSINMGTHYHRILATIDDQTCVVEPVNSDFRAGDDVAIWDWNAHKVRCSAKVVDATPQADGCHVRFDRPVQIVHTGTGAGTTYRSAQMVDGIDRLIDYNTAGRLVVRNCRMSSNRARCILVKASNSLIENNTFYNQYMPAILAGPEFYWGEGSNFKNLTIRNNRFVNMHAPGIRVGTFSSDTSMDNENVLIENNSFEGHDYFDVVNARMRGVDICVTNTTGVVIRNNRFDKPAPNRPAGMPTIMVGRSQDVKCVNNKGAVPQQPVEGTAEQYNEEY